MSTGKLIVIEGPDGVGKSTLAHFICRHAKGHAVYASDPGVSPVTNPLLGQIRHALIKSPQLQNPMARAHAHAMARELLCQDLRNVLNEGMNVILDRFYPSSYAYQYCGDRLSFPDIKFLFDVVEYSRYGNLCPDFIFYLDAPNEVLEERRQALFRDVEAMGEGASRTLDAADIASKEWRERMYGGYRALATALPNDPPGRLAQCFGGKKRRVSCMSRDGYVLSTQAIFEEILPDMAALGLDFIDAYVQEEKPGE